MRIIPRNPLVRAGFVLGAGFGGLADGIVLHSILGWHHLICANTTVFCQPTSVYQLQVENTQDGFFDLALYLIVIAGTVMLFRAARHTVPAWSGWVLLGAMLAGSGFFNFFEGLINHQILGLHHVLPGNAHQFLFDMLYLANGALFFLVGLWLVRRPGHACSVFAGAAQPGCPAPGPSPRVPTDADAASAWENEGDPN
jgi:uncharacterized membrane protein